MKYLRPLLLILLFVTSATAAAASHAVVFMYHRFGEDRYPSTSIQLAQFDAQLDYLEENGFQVWPLQRIIDHIQREEQLPDRTIAITIDDAYRSVYEHAWPRLNARGWPFTVFVSTDQVDRAQREFMSWEQMRAMQQTGVHFANHTASHDSMARQPAGEDDAAWEQRVRTDIERAQQRLREELGAAMEREPRLFAYPYGEYDARAAALVAHLGFVGFGQHSGAIGPRSDRRALPRYAMAESFAALEPFARKASSLPLPLHTVEPWEPRISDNNPPLLTLTLQHPLQGIACYNAAGQPLPIRWLDDIRLQIKSTQPLPAGRSRYNCTSPTADGRWYWYSHLWLVPDTYHTP